MNVRRLATSLPVLTSAALTVVAALVAAPANAETHITQDAVQDVASGAGVKINTPEPDRSEGDLTSMRVKHGGRHLNITLNYVELSKVTGRNTMIHLIAVRSDTRGRADLFDYVQSNKGGQGRTDFYVRGSDGRCPAVRTKIDYAKFLMRASIPNKCLGNPEWVRVGAGAGMTTGGDLIYADDVARDGSFGEDVVFGPKVRIG